MVGSAPVEGAAERYKRGSEVPFNTGRVLADAETDGGKVEPVAGMQQKDDPKQLRQRIERCCTGTASSAYFNTATVCSVEKRCFVIDAPPQQKKFHQKS